MTQDQANELIIRIEALLEELGANRALLVRARTAAAEAWRTPDPERRRELLEQARKLLQQAIEPRWGRPMNWEKVVLIVMLLLGLALIGTALLMVVSLREEIRTTVLPAGTPPEILGDWGSSPGCRADGARCLALWETSRPKP